MKNANAVIIGDVHIRTSVPVCRADSYVVELLKKIDHIKSIMMKHSMEEPPLMLIAGDLFHSWKASPEEILLAMHLIEAFQPAVCPAGNHDLAYHSQEHSVRTTANAVLYKSNYLRRDYETAHIMYTTLGYSDAVPSLPIVKGKKNVLVAHKMVWVRDAKPNPNADREGEAYRFLRQHKGFDLIVTGDNHMTFEVEYKGRRLVNPGSLMRMSADQCDHKPCVYMWCSETNDLVKELIPCRPWKRVRSTFKDQYAKEDTEKIQAFAKRIGEKSAFSLDFRMNLLNAVEQMSSAKKDLQELIEQLLQEGK